MKLICKSCAQHISSENINMAEGIAYCTSCQEAFKIADFLQQTTESSIERTAKPPFTKVTLKHERKNTVVRIPPAGWTGTAVFFLIFTTFWNAVSWTFVFVRPEDEDEPTLFIIPFLLIGILTLAFFLFLLFGTTELHINKNQIQVKWAMFGLSWTRKGNSSHFLQAKQTVIYTQNYEPVYGIKLEFSRGSSISFGSNLTHQERTWLMGELHSLRDNNFDFIPNRKKPLF